MSGLALVVSGLALTLGRANGGGMVRRRAPCDSSNRRCCSFCFDPLSLDLDRLPGSRRSCCCAALRLASRRDASTSRCRDSALSAAPLLARVIVSSARASLRLASTRSLAVDRAASAAAWLSLIGRTRRRYAGRCCVAEAVVVAIGL